MSRTRAAQYEHVLRREIRSEIEVRAPPERVWPALIDFKRYPEWNPFMPRAEGKREVGEKIEVIIRPPGRKEWRIRPTVTSVIPNRRLQWLGRLLLPKVFDGRHTLRVEPAGEGASRVIQEESFVGLLVPFSGKLLDATRRGFEEMNRALKKRVERAGEAAT